MDNLIFSLPTKKGMIEVWEVTGQAEPFYVVTLDSGNRSRHGVCRTAKELRRAMDFANGMFHAIEIVG